MSNAEWPRTRLRFVAQVGPSTPIRHLSDDSEVTFLPLEAVWPDSRYDPSRARLVSEVSSGYTRFLEGDVLVPKITPTFEAARSAIALDLRGGLGFGTTELHVLRPEPQLDARFLWYRTLAHDFIGKGTGAMTGVAGQKRVPSAFIKDFEFFLPPLHEQRHIASFLSREMAKLDELSRLKERLAARLPERLSAAMHAAIASLPRNAKLGYAGSWLSGGTPPKDEPDHWSGPVPWASTKDLVSDDLQDTLDHVTEEAAATYSRIAPEGSILVATRGMALAKRIPLAVTRCPVAFNQDLKALVPMAGVEGNYLRIVLRGYESELLASVVEAAHGTRRLETRYLKALLIPVPDLSTQRRIAEEVREIEVETKGAEESLHQQLALLEERREALITAAVTGALDPAPQPTAAAVAA